MGSIPITRLCASGSVGGARPCQGRGRGFESRLALALKRKDIMRCMVSFLFNEAQPGLEASSDLGTCSSKGSRYLGQTLPSRVRWGCLVLDPPVPPFLMFGMLLIYSGAFLIFRLLFSSIIWYNNKNVLSLELLNEKGVDKHG